MLSRWLVLVALACCVCGGREDPAYVCSMFETDGGGRVTGCEAAVFNAMSEADALARCSASSFAAACQVDAGSRCECELPTPVD